MRWGKKYLAFGLVVLSILSWAGCEHIPGMSATQVQPNAEVTTYSFDDIAVPSQLSADEGASFVFESGMVKAGTLVLSGYVDIDSLKAFFTDSMPRDGWRLKAIFRFPKLVLLFEKPEKVAIIEIYEQTVLTWVEIWVAPALEPKY